MGVGGGGYLRRCPLGLVGFSGSSSSRPPELVEGFGRGASAGSAGLDKLDPLKCDPRGSCSPNPLFRGSSLSRPAELVEAFASRLVYFFTATRYASLLT